MSPTQPERLKWLISRVMQGSNRVNVQQVLPDGSLRFRSDLGTVFCSVNVAANRIDSLFPGSEKVIRI